MALISFSVKFCPLTVPDDLVIVACEPAVLLWIVTPPKQIEPKEILFVIVAVLPD